MKERLLSMTFPSKNAKFKNAVVFIYYKGEYHDPCAERLHGRLAVIDYGQSGVDIKDIANDCKKYAKFSPRKISWCKGSFLCFESEKDWQRWSE